MICKIDYSVYFVGMRPSIYDSFILCSDSILKNTRKSHEIIVDLKCIWGGGGGISSVSTSFNVVLQDRHIVLEDQQYIYAFSHL